MAKKKTAAPGNKSAAIRDYQKKHADAKPKQIAEALGKAGYDVTAQYVSMILSTDRRKSGESAKTTRKTKTAAPKTAAGKSISMDDLLSAKQLIQAAGGISKARQALDAYAKLVDSNK